MKKFVLFAKLFVIKKQNVNKVVFLLPYKIKITITMPIAKIQKIPD
jgi:hypothetical protein